MNEYISGFPSNNKYSANVYFITYFIHTHTYTHIIITKNFDPTNSFRLERKNKYTRIINLYVFCIIPKQRIVLKVTSHITFKFGTSDDRNEYAQWLYINIPSEDEWLQTYMRNDPIQFCRLSILFFFNIIFLIDANNCLQDVVFFCSFFSAKTIINFFIYIYKALNWWFWFFFLKIMKHFCHRT